MTLTYWELCSKPRHDQMELIMCRKWNRISHIMSKSSNSVTKQPLRWTPWGHRDRGWPKNMWKRTWD